MRGHGLTVLLQLRLLHNLGISQLLLLLLTQPLVPRLLLVLLGRALLAPLQDPRDGAECLRRAVAAWNSAC